MSNLGKFLGTAWIFFPPFLLSAESPPTKPTNEPIVQRELPKPGKIELGTTEVSVPIHWFTKRPVVDVRINGKGPYRLFLDTGAQGSVLDQGLADELKLPVVGEARVGSPGGKGLPGKQVRLDRLEVGDAKLSIVQAAAFDRSQLGRGEEVPRGVLSASTFPGYLVTLDYPHSQLLIRRGQLPEPDGARVFGYGEKRPLPEIPLSIAGLDVTLHLDSGSGGGITLPLELAKRLPLTSKPVEVARGKRVDQEVVILGAKLNGQVKLGEYALENPDLRFQDVANAPGHVGYEFLRRFAVTLDASNHRVQLEHIPAADKKAQEKAETVPSKDQAEPKLPDTAAARQLKAWLGAFNSGDADTIRRFITNNMSKSALKEMSAPERVDRELFVYKDTGGLYVTAIEKSSAHEIVVAAKMKRQEKWTRITLNVSEEAPHPITSLGIRVLQSPPLANPGQEKLSQSQIVRELEAFLDKEVADDRFSGAALVAKDGKPIFQKAYGLANQKTNVPNRTDTKFNLGSMNKMFTAVAIMQLVEQGKIAVSDTVGKHLPDYPNKEIGNQVTIDQLLTHTSGMGDYHNDKFFSRSRRLEKVADFVPFFVDEPPAFPPGTKWKYSNAGYVVLGLIIEKISGQSYYDYVRERIYQPAGMVNTDHRFPEKEKANIAIGYTRQGSRGPDAGPRRENTSARPESGSPAGGGYSTVLDMLRFDRALKDHRLLGAESTRLMTTAKKLDEGGFGYAYGFGNHRINGQRLFGHNGGAPGIGAQFDVYPDHGSTVVILSNYDYREMKAVVDKTRELMAR
jgi:CubicO group peptidase (beta-lactamase class C family)